MALLSAVNLWQRFRAAASTSCLGLVFASLAAAYSCILTGASDRLRGAAGTCFASLRRLHRQIADSRDPL